VTVIYIVLPLAILIAAVAVVAFAWAARKGQFDDLETPAHRMLIDDDPISADSDSDSESSLGSGLNAGPANKAKATNDEN
jgi:cbb3-type cytochrome oxidase maturation protein